MSYHVTSQDQLTKDIKNAKGTEREKLRNLYRDLARTVRSGEASTFADALEVLQTDIYSQDELEEIYQDLSEKRAEREAQRLADEELEIKEGQVHLQTSFLSREGLIPDEERSLPRYALAGFLEARGYEGMRAQRVYFYVPTREVEGNLSQYDIPEPTKEDERTIAERYQGQVHEWQYQQQLKLLQEYCAEEDLIPVHAPPRKSSPTQGVAVVMATLMDREFVETLCTLPNGQGASQLHYLSALFSTGSRHEEMPDMRITKYVGLPIEQASLVTEFLGAGPMEADDGTQLADGWGLYFTKERTPQQIQQRMAKVGVVLDEEDATTLARHENTLHALETQGRALMHADDGSPLGLKKGVQKPVDFSFAKQKIAGYYETIENLEIEAKIARMFNTDMARDILEDLEAYKARYEPVCDMLEWATEQEDDVCLFVAGDQIKVGAHRCHEGEASFMGTYLKGKGRPKDAASVPVGEYAGIEPEYWDEDIEPSYEMNGEVLHVRVGEDTVYEKAVQYRPSGNPQVTQLATYDTAPAWERYLARKISEIAGSLNEAKGFAQLISDHAREIMESIEAAEAAGMDQRVEELQADHDLMDEIVRSTLLRNDGEGTEMLLRGEDPPIYNDEGEPESHVVMLKAVLSRIDKVGAARVKHILRSMGMKFYGSHHTTIEDSVGRFDMLNWPKGEHPILDESVVYLPKKIAGPMGADDDGDITNAMAALVPVATADIPAGDVLIRGGRMLRRTEHETQVGSRTETYARLEPIDGPVFYRVREQMAWASMHMRYPCVDAPIAALWRPTVRPIGLHRTEEEKRDFEEVLSIFDWKKPEGADLFDDEIILADSDKIHRLSEAGARDQVAKEKLRGPITLTHAVGGVRRKADLDKTGTMTRDLERICAAINVCHSKVDAGEGIIWEMALEHYLELGARLKVRLEEELVGFKYKTDLGWPPSPYLPDEDGTCPWGFEDARAARQALLPSGGASYHRILARMRSVRKDMRVSGSEALEQMPAMNGMGKEPWAVRRVIAGPGQQVVDAFKAVKTNPQNYLAELSRRLKEDPPSEAEKAQASLAATALHYWRSYWGHVFDEVNKMRPDELSPDASEQYDAMLRFQNRAGKAVREVMRDISRRTSDRALRLALYRHWKADGEEGRHDSGAGALAMLEGRAARIFNHNSLEVVAQEPSHEGCAVFCRGKDWPDLVVGGEVAFDHIDVAGSEKLAAVAVKDEEHYPLYFAHQGSERPPEHAAPRLFATTPRRGYLRWDLQEQS